MGNTAGGFNYDDGEKMDYTNRCGWVLSDGYKKDEKEFKDKVSIFRAGVKNANSLAAKKNVQRLKSLRHPYILAFLDTAETEDVLLLVTESCIPIETWITMAVAAQGGGNEKENAILEGMVVWGFKCILRALDFLHTNCKIVHGNVGPQAIFITLSGDWKLGSLELAGDLSQRDNFDFFAANHGVLQSQFASPERAQLLTGGACYEAVPHHFDIYSMGKLMEYSFNALNMEIPKNLAKYMSNMMHSDAKRRPKATQLIRTVVFQNDQIKLLESISEELSIRTSSETLDILGKLESKLTDIPASICSYKILPAICSTLQMALKDFPLRDARESCRQSVTVTLNLLASMASTNKLEEDVFKHRCMDIILQLWAMSDRTVRSVLLQTLKHLARLTPNAAVNRVIFDNMLAGFSDSSSKMRESTLMSLIYIVEKLDEIQLQEKLVRCILKLQSDPEPSIRTNATIFLGKIASKLKENVRHRILCPSFTKAMKDGFLHCRVAGLKTGLACIKLMDANQVASKLLPQASLLTLDRSSEARVLSLSLADACIACLRENHQRMAERVASQKTSSSSVSAADDGGAATVLSYLGGMSTTPQHQAPAGEGSSSGNSGGWGSWAVIEGLSKTLESATKLAPAQSPAADGVTAEPLATAVPGSHVQVEERLIRGDLLSGASSLSLKHHSVGSALSDADCGSPMDQALDLPQKIDFAGWGDEDSLEGLDDDDAPIESFSRSKDSDPPASSKQGIHSAVSVPAAERSVPTTLVKSQEKKTLTTSNSGSKMKSAKVAVKKLDVGKDDGWEDF